MNEDICELEKGKERGFKLYQDQLYGTKVLTPLAVAIIDTPEFQRLAGLRQLGFTDVTYRGAQHTRFSHSVGTYLMTKTIMRRIVQNHERLGLRHPGEDLPKCFCTYPDNAFLNSNKTETENPPSISCQSLWRGLMEVVSIAALLHDIGHVPFGHTLEDEFVGIYDRHDNLGNPRLYEMLFNPQSELKKVFECKDQWIRPPADFAGITNEELAQLIYVILSWKEEIKPPKEFDAILLEKIVGLINPQNASQVSTEFMNQQLDSWEKSNNPSAKKLARLISLKRWHGKFREKKLFQPFMADLIGNTICADLLDYLPRDRMNLGMEFRKHDRLQRYLTIRSGTLYPDEGLRVSIMVTRPGRGGQRPDVATAVLDIMRERYEMAERVYYHHKKAAVSAMLAKLVELCPSAKPVDDENIYPAPWSTGGDEKPNIIHFSDGSFIDQFRNAATKEEQKADKADPVIVEEQKALQKKLYSGIRYDRRAIYRTLMVVDTDLIHLSKYPISYYEKQLREHQGKPSNKGRQELEQYLASESAVPDGEVLIYCPSPDMQSKEINARLEIKDHKVVPLRLQRESFAYQDDVRVLEQYYQELWRMYIFVSPKIFENLDSCKRIVDNFCKRYGIEQLVAYPKVRHYNFQLGNNVDAKKANEPLRAYLVNNGDKGTPFKEIPKDIVAALYSCASIDPAYKECINNGTDPLERITTMLAMVTLEAEKSRFAKKKSDKNKVETYIRDLRDERTSPRMAAREKDGSLFEGGFDQYRNDLVEDALAYTPK